MRMTGCEVLGMSHIYIFWYQLKLFFHSELHFCIKIHIDPNVKINEIFTIHKLQVVITTVNFCLVNVLTYLKVASN